MYVPILHVIVVQSHGYYIRVVNQVMKGFWKLFLKIVLYKQKIHNFFSYFPSLLEHPLHILKRIPSTAVNIPIIF